MKVAIFGGGFVGFTCYQVFSKSPHEVGIYDVNKEGSKAYLEGDDVKFFSLEEAVQADLVFVCVPTPMSKETGECRTHIVEGVIHDVREARQKSLIIIKSTVPPGTTEAMNEKYGNVAFSPEFLTEANALDDFISTGYQIIGSKNTQHQDTFASLIKSCPEIQDHLIEPLEPTEAEMVKYIRNTYLATRLSFFNEIKQICDKLGIYYPYLKYFAGLDQRVGGHYNSVNEDNPGFGGHCLPKDLNAMIFKAKELGVEPKVLKAVNEKNLEVRKNRDWETMEGRAIVNK